MKNVLAFLTKYKTMDAQKKALEKELEKMKKELHDYVLTVAERDEKGKATYSCNPFTVTVTACKKTGLDEKTIRALFPEIASAHTTETTYDKTEVK